MWSWKDHTSTYYHISAGGCLNDDQCTDGANIFCNNPGVDSGVCGMYCIELPCDNLLAWKEYIVVKFYLLNHTL